MKCKLFVPEDFEALYKTFTAAFSNHEIKLQPSKEDFKHRIYNKLMLDPDISAGTFDGEEMLGFILHSSNVFQGVPTAYNGGTGVLPGFRNQRIAEDLYEYLIPKIQSKFLARILLEVVEVNEYAIKLYEKIGFSFKRRFMCFKQVRELHAYKQPWDVKKGSLEEVDFAFNDFDPSFLDSESSLRLGNEDTLLVRERGVLKGYLVFRYQTGRISQIAIANSARAKGIGSSLILEAQKLSAKPLTIMNIPDDQNGMHLFLERNGFENQVNQFEMELII